MIHTVGPVWHGGSYGESDLLNSCYAQSLQRAVENGIRSIAFPAISCGAYRYPISAATQIAVHSIQHFMQSHPQMERVIICAFTDEVYESYSQSLKT